MSSIARCAFVWLAIAPATSAAAEPPITVATEPSPYERSTLTAAVARVGGVEEPHPEGKVIESIEIVTLDPIEQRDPVPTFLNSAHVTTRRYVIAREILVHTGDAYRQALVDETARNLRRLPQLSIVLCAPLRGSAPDRVKLLVVTKDVWSLFVDFDFSITAGGLERLTLKPRETNVAGRQTTAFARFVQEPSAYSIGGGYVVPRVEGRRLALAIDANILVNRARDTPEGSFGTFSATRALYATRTEWAWLTGVTWRDEMYRRYSNASVATVGGVPWEYRSRAFSQQLAVTRSFGWRYKDDLTGGFEVTNRTYLTNEPAVRTVLPTSERRVGPYLQWHAHSADFLRGLDIETLGLQEDVKLGHEVLVRVYPVTMALGSTRTFLGVRAGASYTAPLGDGFVRAGVVSVTEAERERVSDASIEALLRIVTPRTGIGRIVFDASFLNRYRNHLRALSFLGGEGRLRGYPTRALTGSDVIAMNLEYRARPIELAAMQLGLALFYDLGDAFNGWDDLRLHHAVGAGLRLVLPQFDRSVLRVDVATPLDGNSPAVFIGFNHAFPVRGVGPPQPSPTPTIGGALGY